MDQENLQSKGFFGVLGFSIRLIHSRRRLFLSLAASILLPLAALSLAALPIAARVIDSETDSRYSTYRRNRRVVSGILFSLIYGIIYLFAVLLAAGAAIHAAASAYAAKEAASLRKSLLRAAPRAWPRLLGTSFWGLLLTVVYLLAGAFIFGLALGLANVSLKSAVVLRVLAIILACAVGAVYIAGALYVSFLWHLAVAATVLEGTGPLDSSCWGIAAIRKARALVRGRAIMCCALLVLFDGLIYIVGDLCWDLALYGPRVPLLGRIAAGAVILVALTGLFLFGMTVLAVVYLALKAWHGEAVPAVSLAAKLDACAGEYERMVVPQGGAGAGNVQMMHQMV